LISSASCADTSQFNKNVNAILNPLFVSLRHDGRRYDQDSTDAVASASVLHRCRASGVDSNVGQAIDADTFMCAEEARCLPAK